MVMNSMWVVTCLTRKLISRNKRIVRRSNGIAYRFVTMAANETEAIEKVRLVKTTLSENILRETGEELIGWSATVADDVETLQSFTGPTSSLC